ncbi:lysophospholipid acyltransferase family protein [Chloroflexota bacterium]
MYWIYYTGIFLIRMVLFLLTRYRVNGEENIPAQGPLLIVANHISMADPPILGASIGRKAMFMAKEELFRARFSSYVIRSFGAFPVRRGGLDRKSLNQAEQWLARGMVLVMFPEGQRSKTTQLQPAFSGSALIASRIGAPILPVGITGTEKIKGMNWWLRRPKITVNIGHPFHPSPGSDKLTKSELAQQTNAIMEHIAELLPPEYRGHYTGEEHKKA